MRLREIMITEHQEQEVFMDWMKKFHPKIYDLTYHIPNGRTSAREGAKYKRLGAKSGVPDIFIAYPRKPYHGLYIEFKRIDGGSGLSENQVDWIYRLQLVGYCAVVANGCSKAIDIFEEYIKGEKWGR